MKRIKQQSTKPKEYLYQLWNIDKEIQQKLEVLERAKAQIGIRAQPDPEQNAGRSGSVSDPVFNYVAKITRLEKQLDQMTDHYIDLKAKIIGQIDGMDNRVFRMLLTARYVLMMDWKDVADSIGYSEAQTYRIHGRALQDFYQMYLKR